MLQAACRLHKKNTIVGKSDKDDQHFPLWIAADNRRTLSPEFEALVGYVHKDLTPCLNHALKDLGSVSGRCLQSCTSAQNTAGLSRQAGQSLLQAWRQAMQSRHALWPCVLCGCAVCLPAVTLSQEECNASLARVKKDAKLMPALVYAMEGWEKQLVSTGQPPANNTLLLQGTCRKWCRWPLSGVQQSALLKSFRFSCTRRQVRQQKPAARCQALLLP